MCYTIFLHALCKCIWNLLFCHQVFASYCIYRMIPQFRFRAEPIEQWPTAEGVGHSINVYGQIMNLNYKFK